MIPADCPRFGKWFGGCKFEARYDKGIADLSQFHSIKRMEEPIVDKFRPVTYIHDICIRCGKTIRPTPDTTQERTP